MKPTSILDPRFKYTPSEKTTPDYLHKKFAQIRRELAKAGAEKQKATVTQLKHEAHDAYLSAKRELHPFGNL